MLWVAGMLLLAYVTNGGVNVYEQVLFSAHMLGHMALTMAVPVLLVPGAPVTLAARAIRARKDGSRGGREWILLAVHSRFAGIIANPIVAAVLFAGSLWVFYYSPLFRWTMLDHIGHEWMIGHFLLTGYLFVQSLIGIDPVPYRLPYPFRLVLLLGTMAFHAFFGLAIMSGTGLLLADWYGAMGWGTDALADQQLGGGIAWSIGEIPTVALAITVAVQWARSDEKESRRRDRHADRTGDAELEAYNARLAAIAEHDRRGEHAEERVTDAAARHASRTAGHFSWIAMLPSGRMLAVSASRNGWSSSSWKISPSNSDCTSTEMCATPSVGGISKALSPGARVTTGMVTMLHTGSLTTRSSISVPKGQPAGCSTGWVVHALRYSSTWIWTRSTNVAVGTESTVTAVRTDRFDGHRGGHGLEQRRRVPELVDGRCDREVGGDLRERRQLVARLRRARVERERADREERVVRRGHVDDRDRAHRELPPGEHTVERFERPNVERRLDDGRVETVARRDRVRAVGIRDVAHDPDVLGAGLDDLRAEHRRRHVLGEAERGELLGVEGDPGGRRRRRDVVIGDGAEVALDEARRTVDRLVQASERSEERPDEDHGEHQPPGDGQQRQSTAAHA